MFPSSNNTNYPNRPPLSMAGPPRPAAAYQAEANEEQQGYEEPQEQS